MTTRRYKEVKVPVHILDVLSMDERELLRQAVRHWRDSLVPVSQTGHKELYWKLDDLDERLRKGM